MSINILNDNEKYETTIFYAYNDEVELMRYKNQRYKPMNVYKKDNLDQISKYAQKCESGIVADICATFIKGPLIPPKASLI